MPAPAADSPNKRVKLDDEKEVAPRLPSPVDMTTTDTRVLAMHGLYPPGCVRADYPITAQVADQVTAWRREIEAILRGEDDRLIVVVGPCSIHDTEAALEYANLLKPVYESLKKDLLIVMRVYFEKPRTTVGWKGLINDPDLDGSYRINKGLVVARKFLVAINQLGLPVGTEFLDTISPQYTSDLVSWGAIGARTTESQVHRELASGLSCPVGFKNGTAGSVQIAVDAVQSARGSHSFLGVNEWGNAAIVVTKGNDACHVILRGGSDGTNYSKEHVESAEKIIKKGGCKNAVVMIDCSHGNSLKKHQNQPLVSKDVAEQVAAGSKAVIGVMIESNLVEGNQKCDPGVTDVSKLVRGQSITDACVDFPTTEKMMNELAAAVRARRAARPAL